MEQLLLKMARQLDSLDEASLMALWEKYATLVSHFEPTKRWEEAALVFSLIQSKHWKNQLFNTNWADQSRPSSGEHVHNIDFGFQGLDPANPLGKRMASIRLERDPAPAGDASDTSPAPEKHAKIIAFRPRKTQPDPILMEDVAPDTPDTPEDSDTDPKQS